MSGTFNVHSSYSIDGGTATDFIPANTFVSFQYNQKFFQSDTLSNDEHTLLITNLGEEFWLDYLVVTQSPPSTTTTTHSIAPQTVQSTSSSTTLTAPPTTNPAATTSASQQGSIMPSTRYYPSSRSMDAAFIGYYDENRVKPAAFENFTNTPHMELGFTGIQTLHDLVDQTEKYYGDRILR